MIQANGPLSPVPGPRSIDARAAVPDAAASRPGGPSNLGDRAPGTGDQFR